MNQNYSALPHDIKSQFHKIHDFDNKNPSFSQPTSLNLLSVDENLPKSPNGVHPYDQIRHLDIENHPLTMGGGGGGGGFGAGVSGAVFNLATSIIGAGIMALPATMKVLGLVLGLVLIVVMGVLSEISVELLIKFAVQSNAMSYGEVVQQALGRPARVISEICIILNNAGFLVVYLIIIGDVMSGSTHHMGVMDQLIGTGVWDHRKLLILAVLIVFLAPLCALDKIDSLSLTSAASVILAIIFVIITCVVAFIKLAEGRIDRPRMLPDISSKNSILDLLLVIPIIANAYVCHFNVQTVYNELEEKSPEKMYRVGRITTVVCVIVYAFTGVSGYLLFGNKTESDVLTNFDVSLGVEYSSVLDYIVRVGYILHLVLVFPVIHFSLRETVNALLFSESPPLSENRSKVLWMTLVLLALIYLGSTMIPNIWTAFKFTGATTAIALGFIFPTLIALRLNGHGENLTPGEKVFSWTMLVVAIMVGVVGVVGNIYGLKTKSQ